jgi:hypothetical protein
MEGIVKSNYVKCQPGIDWPVKPKQVEISIVNFGWHISIIKAKFIKNAPAYTEVLPTSIYKQKYTSAHLLNTFLLTSF